MTAPSENLRWKDYFLRRSIDVTAFWGSLLAAGPRNILFVLGDGFDRRMCACTELLLGLQGEGKRDAWLLQFEEGDGSHSHTYSSQRKINSDRLAKAFDGRGSITKVPINLFSKSGRRIGDRSVVNAFNDPKALGAYTDIVTDISALPRGLYLPLLSKLLRIIDGTAGRQPNLHVMVAHSATTDGQVVPQGLAESASLLHGFSAASFQRDGTRDLPTVWIPLLGHGRLPHLERIYDLVSPDEVCPLLPSPARNPREADDLILEYRQFLFDQLRVEPENMIYASEENPFEVYRQLCRSMLDYKRALAPLGGAKFVLSALSTKLLSVGALLAAYELSQWRTGGDQIDISIAHVAADGYRMVDTTDDAPPMEFHTMWLTGECHANE